jgi:phosphatidate cytidylyltransferase
LLRWRLLLGILLITALAGICWLDARAPGCWLGPLSLIVAVLASGELLWLFRSAGIEARAPVVYAGNFSIVAASWAPLLWRPADWPTDVAWPALAFVAWMLVAFVIEIFCYRKPGSVTSRLAATVFGLAYIGLLLSFLVLLRCLDFGFTALLSLIVVVKLGDIGAYTVGRLCGRHKLAPYLSPGKTIEGAVGGIVFSCGGAWLVLQGLTNYFRGADVVSMAGWNWVIFGGVVGIAGMLGDLAESLLKRDLGRKDSSNWLPGFGGVLDIIDSLLVAAPVAYLLWRVGLAGHFTALNCRLATDWWRF